MLFFQLRIICPRRCATQSDINVRKQHIPNHVLYLTINCDQINYSYLIFTAQRDSTARTRYGNVSVWVAPWLGVLSVTAGIVSKRLNLS